MQLKCILYNYAEGDWWLKSPKDHRIYKEALGDKREEKNLIKAAVQPEKNEHYCKWKKNDKIKDRSNYEEEDITCLQAINPRRIIKLWIPLMSLHYMYLVFAFFPPSNHSCLRNIINK